MNIRERLLSTTLFEDNQYFELYIKLIQDNAQTQKEKFKTQRHHILPRVAFKMCNLEIGCEDCENVINLNYKDHILAHYYLALASAENEFKYKMIAAINFILGRVKQDILDVEELKVFTLELEKYQQLYEESREYFASKIRGTTHETSQETRDKIGKSNSGKIYVNKDGIVKSILPQEEAQFIEDGWERGNPNSQKRNTHKGCTIVNKNGIEKYVSKDELNRYLEEGWIHGRSESHKESAKKGTIAYFNTLTPEERRKKCASYGALGTHWTKERREKMEIKLREYRSNTDRSGTIWMTNGIVSRIISPNEEQSLIEQGFWRGRTMKNKKRGDF